jgi:hypothetical protein
MPLERGRVPNVTLQESKDWVRYARIAFIVVYIIGGIATVRFSKTDANIWGLITGGLGFAVIAYLFVRFVLPLVLWMVKGGKGIAGAFTGRRSKVKNGQAPQGFYVRLGTSTGELARLSHGAGMEANQDIFLTLPDAAQNIVTIGGTGSGKTTRIMQPLLVQLLRQDCGGLIFDVKGDFKNSVLKLAGQNSRRVIPVGIGQAGLNLLKGLTPEMSSSFLKSAFFLAGGGGDKFWVDTATELCKNSLGVLSFVPGAYSLEALYKYLFFEADREDFNGAAGKQLAGLDPKQTRLFLSYKNYYEAVFSNFDEKVKQGVLATVAQVLSPFQHPDLIDAFCTDHEQAANMENVLNGDIYLVDLPLAVWGLGAKAVYTFIKLRFFNVLQSRTARTDFNQERPVFFMCDEYQDVISANKTGLSDLNFWDKSRSAKCVGIISTQSINSFRSAIGDRVLADTVLQNFRQKICFRTEDVDTVSYLNQLGGNVEVQRISETRSSGVSSSSQQEGSSTSLSWTERPIIDAQLIRRLGPDQAIAFLNIDGLAMDDVINLVPVFAN